MLWILAMYFFYFFLVKVIYYPHTKQHSLIIVLLLVIISGLVCLSCINWNLYLLQIILTHEHADATLGLDDIRVVQPFSHTNDIDPTPVYLTQYAMDRYFYTLWNTWQTLFKFFASNVGIIDSGIAYFIFGITSLHVLHNYLR